MNEFILYLLKSTVCLSLLYLVFRFLMRKEAFFALNRMLLLAIVLFSLTVPLITMPQIMRTATPVNLMPAFATTENILQELPQAGINNQVEVTAPAPESTKPTVFPVSQLLQYVYLTGLLITLLILIRVFVSIFLLFRKARTVRMENFRLLIVDKEIPAFSFGRLVVISGEDYRDHQQAMLAHEQAHIRLNHFFDLLFLELVKIIHWFNPVVYLLIRDMKEIHEFQADQFTLNKGINATKYQMLIIQKGVGSQRFALANSFNHGRIKKRIAMINQPKSGKRWSWKLVVFLPLVAMMLMAFGKQLENEVVVQKQRIPINQKGAVVQPIVNGISSEQLLEYENIVNKITNDKGVPEVSQLTDTDKKRLETLFLSMNKEQRSAQMVIFIPKPPPLPNSVPTPEQMKTWEDSMIYGIWINDKRVNNSDFKKYKNTDFAEVFVSKLEKNALNYGKHYYQVNLMTNEYYANFLKRMELADKYWIATRKKKETTQLISPSPQLRLEQKIAKDSLSIRTENSENVEIFSADKVVYDSKKPSVIYLYNAELRYKDTKLTGDYIRFNKDSNLVVATGRRDSTGNMVGKPVFTQGKQEFSAAEIRFNFKTKKGVIFDNDKSTKF